MKDLLINSAMSNIEKNLNYDKEKLAEIRYGLASLYLTITKTIVIFTLSYLMGNLKSLLILMTLYGVHAKKSWQCWVSSLLIFLTIPYLCKILILNYKVKITCGIICVILLSFYAPADTEKRPLINKKRRTIYGVISALLGLLYISGSILIKDNMISNCFLFAVIIETIVVLPITYKLFGVSYNNYKKYNKEE